MLRRPRTKRPLVLLTAAALAGSVMATVSTTTATATVATGRAAAATAAATADAGSPFTIWAPARIEAMVGHHQQRAWVDLGIRAVAGADAFELRSRRASYDQPITASWTAGTRSGVIPAGLQKDFAGLRNFLRVEFRTPGGKLVAARKLDACFNASSERARPDAPATSPYPWGCPWNPFTVGSVQGIQAGWASPVAAMQRPIRIGHGTYDVQISVNGTWADALGLAEADRTRTSKLVVRRQKTRGHDHSSPGQQERPSAPAPQPAASEPTARAAGSTAPRPDLRSLPAFGIETNGKGTHLRFSATVWNAGDSPLVVDGFRRPGEDVMDAYQYFFDAEGEQVGYQQVGELHYHRANHQHWHFQDFARYRLLKADKSEAARSGKVSFCLANTDAVDYTVPGADWRPESTDLTTACGEPGSLSVREVLASGSGDTYAQFRAGQSFNLEGLPNGWYYIAVEANPMGNLVEQDTTNNVSLRRVFIGGRPGARTVKVSPVGIIDEQVAGGWM